MKTRLGRALAGVLATFAVGISTLTAHAGAEGLRGLNGTWGNGVIAAPDLRGSGAGITGGCWLPWPQGCGLFCPFCGSETEVIGDGVLCRVCGAELPCDGSGQCDPVEPWPYPVPDLPKPGFPDPLPLPMMPEDDPQPWLFLMEP